MLNSRRNLCRRKYDELHAKFSTAIDELCRQHNYGMKDVDVSMRRILKIAEFREPTSNDMSVSAATSRISKRHLEHFFHIFRKLVGQDEQSISDQVSKTSSDHCRTNLTEQSMCISENNQQPGTLFSSDSSPNYEMEEPPLIPPGREAFEVERIISRTVNAEGTKIYHLKWVGYDTSSEPENFVEEKYMMCPDLIKDFESKERLKEKQRSKKVGKARRMRKRKLGTKWTEQSQTCKVLNLCSSTSDEEDNNEPISNHTANTAKQQSCAKYSEGIGTRVNGVHRVRELPKKRKKSLKLMRTMRRRILSSSSECEEVEEASQTHVKHEERESLLESIDEVNGEAQTFNTNAHNVGSWDYTTKGCVQQSGCKITADDSVLHDAINDCKTISVCSKQGLRISESTKKNEPDDRYGGFKYVSTESDGFRKGFKAIKISFITLHPITYHVVGIVVFIHPENGNEFAQYIPLREIQENAPWVLHQYFLNANSKDQKELALSLLLRKPTNSSPFLLRCL